MATFTGAALLAKFKALFGDSENASQEVSQRVEEAVAKQQVYMFPELHFTAAKRNALLSEAAQTISLSASQNLIERTIMHCAAAGKIVAVEFYQQVSSTLTVTSTMGWYLQINKRKSGISSTSATVSYSQTFYVAGITNVTGTPKGGSKSFSWSTITRNTNVMLPNPCLLSRTASKLEFAPRDIITARVRKGSSATAATSNDSGAIFRGGKIVVYWVPQ